MRILIHSLTFSPDGVSTAYLYKDIALRFHREGHEVIVLTSTPHYNLVPDEIQKQPIKWKVWPFLKKSELDGVPVIHIPQKKFKSTLLRLFSFVYFHIAAFITVMFIGHIDAILSPSPPLTLGWLNLLYKKIKRCKVVYNVQEIYPDILNLKEGSVRRFLSWMEKSVYDKSDAVTTIDNVFYNTIKGRFKEPGKLSIIPNFVDTDIYNEKIGHEGLDKSIFPDSESIKLLYAGNIGFAQDWETFIGMAKETKDLPVDYYVIGRGVMKPYVEKEVERLELKKVHILPYQNREFMPKIIAYSDMQFIFMTPSMDMQGFPSKVYTIMACGKPMLVCSGEGTPIVDFLSPIGCAKIITDRNIPDRTKAASEYLRQVSKEALSAMGAKGITVIRKEYSSEIVTKRYVELVESVVIKTIGLINSGKR